MILLLSPSDIDLLSIRREHEVVPYRCADHARVA